MTKLSRKFVPLEKGKRYTFSFPKRKSTKKKLANLRFDRRCVWDSYTAKPTRLCAKAQCWSIVTIRLAKGYFAARGSLDDFDHMEAFLLVRRGNCFSPKSLFDSLGVYTKNPFIVVLRDFIAKAYWGLNKTVGRLAVPSMYHERSARLPYTLYDDKEPWTAKFLSPSKLCTFRCAFAKSERALVDRDPILDSSPAARWFTSFCNFFF